MRISTFLFGIVCLCVFLPGSALRAQVLINEFMASNGVTVADEDGDYEDWLELYNAGTEAVTLAGYGLSDDASNPYKWVFPAVTIEADAYLLIWASGKDRTSPAAPLHTSWSISAAGEDLLLTDAAGNTLDFIPAIAVPRDLSYGRAPNGEPSLYFFDKPTPGKPNAGKGYVGILARPQLVYTQLGPDSWEIELTHPDPEVELYYSLNGADPVARGSLYQDPVTLDDWSDDSLRYIRTVPEEVAPSLFGWIPPEGAFPAMRVVRYTAHRPGYLPPPTQSHTLNVDSVSLPVISIVVDPADLFDDTIGIYVPGLIYQELGFNHNDFWGQPHGNYFQRGPAWERTASMEWFYPGEARHQEQVGLRIHGAGSRALAQKSFRVYARNGFGKSEFEVDLFKNGIQGYRQFLLRNSGQDCLWQPTMLRDATLHQAVAHFNMETQDYQPALVYINGEFWGIHNLRERYNDDYLALKYGLEPERIDYLNNDLEINYGSPDHFKGLLDYLADHDLAEEVHYQHISTLLDPENLADYYIAQIYTANYDWPGNNQDYWRMRTDAFVPDAPYGQDGRWRWNMIDLDYTFGMHGPAGVTYNMLEHMTVEGGQDWPNQNWSTFLPRKMFESELFKTYFINRFCDQLNTGLRPARVEALIEANAERIEPYMPQHIRRWGRPGDLIEWLNNLEGLISFAEKRPGHVRQHLKSFFQLEAQVAINLQVSYPAYGHVRVNTVDIHPATPGVDEQPYPWTGLYFQGLPITLEAIPAPGYRFVRWEGLEEEATNPATVVWEESLVSVLAVFEQMDPGVGVALHYWHFNDLPSGILMDVAADVSKVAGGLITYPGSGDGYMDRVNDGTDIHALPGLGGGLGLRVRNPADTRELIMHVPTNGHENIRLEYAVNRTPNGATQQALYYSTTMPPEWHLWEADIEVGAHYQGYSFDLFGMEAVNNNPDFAIRILFEGPAASNSTGNNRFDNILLTADQISPVTPPGQDEMAFRIFPNPASEAFFLEWRQLEAGNVQVRIFDLTGRVVLDRSIAGSAQATQVKVVDVQHLPAGMYVVMLEDSAGNRSARKLVRD